MSSLRIIFAGTPDFAAHHLQYLLNAHRHEVIAIYTQPDRPAGRGKHLTSSPVKKLAQAHQIPVYQPSTLKDVKVQQALVSLQADLMVVVAYGLILPQAVLNIPRLGCINVHGSLLPKWRGAAPIQRAVCAGDTQTGITIMQMDAGLDTGPMLRKQVCTIQAHETSASLYEKLAKIGPPTLSAVIDDLADGKVEPVAQDDSQASYADKLTKAEAALDWSQSAIVLERQIRGLNPWPGAYCQLDDQQIKIWQASVCAQQTDALAGEIGEIVEINQQGISVATGCGVLRLECLQMPGKKTMAATDLLNGYATLFVKRKRLFTPQVNQESIS